MKAEKVQTQKQKYQAIHRLYGDNNIYESWIQLVDDTLMLAEEEAKKRLMSQLVELTMKISDEMIASVVVVNEA